MHTKLTWPFCERETEKKRMRFFHVGHFNQFNPFHRGVIVGQSQVSRLSVAVLRAVGLACTGEASTTHGSVYGPAA